MILGRRYFYHLPNAHSMELLLRIVDPFQYNRWVIVDHPVCTILTFTT